MTHHPLRTRVISNIQPLRAEFVPKDVRHRDGEVDALTSTLAPLLDGRRTESAVLDGPSGTGKTCIARHVTDRLQREADVDVRYVNCWETHTRFKTLQRLLEGLGRGYDVHRQSTPRDELLDRLREARERPYVAGLDEVDQLVEKGVLYDLHRTRGLLLVLVATSEEELFAALDERVASRLTAATRIHFDRYGSDELVGILEDRVRWDLREDAVAREQLRWIADASVGDARVAIGTLRTAAQTAETRGLDRVTDAVLREAAPDARAEIRRRSLEKLTPHQRVVYEIVAGGEGIDPDALYDAYCERVDDPVTHRTVRSYLRKMRRYNLVRAEGRGRARIYRPPS